MRIISVASLICCLLSACSSGTGNDDPLDPRVQGFRQGLITLTAKPNKVVLDQPITITTRCVPLVSGKGRLMLTGYGPDPTSAWEIESPTHYVFNRMNRDSWATADVEFTANQAFEQEWRVHFLASTPYYITAHITLDSVLLADSNRLYDIDSDIALRYTNGNGYNAVANSNYINLYP